MSRVALLLLFFVFHTGSSEARRVKEEETGRFWIRICSSEDAKDRARCNAKLREAASKTRICPPPGATPEGLREYMMRRLDLYPGLHSDEFEGTAVAFFEAVWPCR
jgi:hypothetical protein